MNHHRLFVAAFGHQSLAAVAAVAISGGAVLGQGVSRGVAEDVDVVTPSGQQIHFVISGGSEYQFATSSDDGGGFNVWRVGGGVGAQMDISKEISAAFNVNYSLDMYHDYNSGTLGIPAPGEPWDNIHTLAATLVFSWHINNDWTIFGGPVFQSSREETADFNDSLTAGGAIGATYRVSRDLTIGGGVAVTSQIEDDVRVQPILVIDWQIAHDFRIRNTSTSNAVQRSGVELIYDAGRGWEFAVGGAWHFSRFRLDDRDPAASGVGQDESIPLWFRASYSPCKQLTIDGVLGANCWGQLDLEDSTGANLASTDYDPAFFVGLFVNFRF